MEQRQNDAIAVGAATLATGLAIGGTAVTLAMASSSVESGVWFRPSLFVAGGLVLVGLYLLIGPYLGMPVPEPRSVPIWHGAWSHLPFSRKSRARRAQSCYRKADDLLRTRIETEVERIGFTERTAPLSVLKGLTLPTRTYIVRRYARVPMGSDPWLNWQPPPRPTKGTYTLMLEDQDHWVTKVVGSTLADPDVVERIRQFEELVSAAREWPETKRREKLLDKYKGLDPLRIYS